MLMWPVTGLCFRRFSKISDYFVAFQHSTFCVDVLCSLYTTSHCTVHLLCCSLPHKHTLILWHAFSPGSSSCPKTLTWKLLDLETEPITLQLVADPLYLLRHCSLYVRLKISDWHTQTFGGERLKTSCRMHQFLPGCFLFFSANSSSLYVTRIPHLCFPPSALENKTLKGTL